MLKFLKNRSINRANIVGIVLAAILAASMAFLVIFNEYTDFKNELKVIEKNYFKQQKDSIAKETNRALKYIEYKHKKDGDKKSLKELQAEIVDAIEQMRNERDGSGYVFIYTFDGINIADPILKQNAGKNLINFTDPNGKKVIAELIKVSKQKDGGYVEYVWNKPLANRLAPKISYAKAYKPWRWMVGSGVYLDDVQKVIKKKREEYDKKISKFIIQILTLTLLLFFASVAIYRYITYLITEEINHIESSFESASKDYKLIDEDAFLFKEFKEISKLANAMIKKIKEKTEALEELNLTLENKVLQKTKKIQKAKEYVEELLEKQDKFVKNAIHEINTPLTIILTNIELYNFKNPKNRYLTKIEAAVKIIHNIYNDLSYLVKKDRVEYKKEILDFSSFLKTRVDFFDEVARANMLEFVSDIKEDVKIFFNEIQLQRICDNNISNAIKYSFENEKIYIRLYKRDENPVFEVVNKGEEIASPNKLFERFYRGDNARGGFGIGLNLVKEICDKNGVKVEVLSKNSFNTFRYIFNRIENEDTAS